jgi:hypothetical protein
VVREYEEDGDGSETFDVEAEARCLGPGGGSTLGRSPRRRQDIA